MRTIAKIDNNHKQIVDDLRALGFKVRSIAQLKNACDLIVYKDGITLLFEVKSDKKIKEFPFHDRDRFMTEGERRFAKDFPVFVIVDADEAVKIYNIKKTL